MITDRLGSSPVPDDRSQKIDEMKARVVQYLEASKAPSTRYAYKKDWQNFTDWADEHHLETMPTSPGTLALYIAWMADVGRKPSSIKRAMTTIRQAHLAFSEQPPTNHPSVVEVYQGIKRTHGTAQKKARPILLEMLKKICAVIPPSFLGKRDKAILAIGWAAAMRRSEIVALDVDDIDFCPEGCTVRIGRSKTDQVAQGVSVGVPFAKDREFCPARALRSWIEFAEITDGCLFPSLGNPGKLFAQLDLLRGGYSADLDLSERLTGRTVNTIIARRMEKAGYRSKGFSGHSLRAGFITSAARAKLPEYEIQRLSRHASAQTLRGYVREELFANNPLSVLL